METTFAQSLGSDGEALLTALLESTIDAVYAVDAAGRVLFANPAALRILGYGAEQELIGRDSHATIHHHRPDGQPFPEADCPLLAPRSSGAAVRVEEDWFLRKDGTFVPVAYSSAPVNVDGGRGAVVVFRDVSDRRRAARIVEATLEERRRLGRDLHDGAQQRLINVIVALQLAAQKADPEARGLVADALAATQQAIDDLRALAAGLHPSVLTHHGLRAAVSSLTGPMPLAVEIDLPDDRFGDLVEGTAYFMIAEALANVAKHSGASHARVSGARDGDRLAIEVVDDGRGGALVGGGSGLSGLADRVAAIGGTLSVESGIGGGTRLMVELPLGLGLELGSG
ncbi:MAG: sensor histidine kinase [Solirubrobacteraceae bacterium]